MADRHGKSNMHISCNFIVNTPKKSFCDKSGEYEGKETVGSILFSTEFPYMDKKLKYYKMAAHLIQKCIFNILFLYLFQKVSYKILHFHIATPIISQHNESMNTTEQNVISLMAETKCSFLLQQVASHITYLNFNGHASLHTLQPNRPCVADANY
jgi:hypothetical protein